MKLNLAFAFAVLIRESKSLHNEIVSSEIVQKAASFLFLRFKIGLLLLLLFLVVKTTVSGKRIFRGAFHLPTGFLKFRLVVPPKDFWEQRLFTIYNANRSVHTVS